MTAHPIKKTDNIYAITYDDNVKVGDVEWGARRYDETESSSDSGEEEGPFDIKGYDPKKKQRIMARYAAIGVGIFLVTFFLIGGAIQVFSASEDESNMKNTEIDFGADDAGSASNEIDAPDQPSDAADAPSEPDADTDFNADDAGSASNEIDVPVQPKDTADATTEPEPDSEAEPESEPDTDESTNGESTSDTNIDEIEGPPGEPESFVNVDPAEVPVGANWILRVSAGASRDYTDPSGHVWLADNGKSKLFSINGDAKTYEQCPLEVEHSEYGGPELYCNERFFPEGKEGGYDVPVPDAGVYEVSLYFADIFFDKTGEREFDVLVEGRMLHRKFDIVQAAGAGNTATRIQTTQEITDGAVTIVFRGHTQNSKISAFEVRRVTDLQEN